MKNTSVCMANSNIYLATYIQSTEKKTQAPQFANTGLRELKNDEQIGEALVPFCFRLQMSICANWHTGRLVRDKNCPGHKPRCPAPRELRLGCAESKATLNVLGNGPESELPNRLWIRKMKMLARPLPRATHQRSVGQAVLLKCSESRLNSVVACPWRCAHALCLPRVSTASPPRTSCQSQSRPSAEPAHEAGGLNTSNQNPSTQPSPPPFAWSHARSTLQWGGPGWPPAGNPRLTNSSFP